MSAMSTQSTAPVSMLPKEMISHVLSFLGPKDLKACSAVCTLWETEARWAFFVYQFIDSWDRAQALKVDLEESPSKGRRIITLYICANEEEKDNEDYSWMRTALIELAPLVPNLECLTLHHWGAQAFGNTDEVRDALRSLARVTKLDLRAPLLHFNEELDDFVFSLPSLSSLRLEEVRWKYTNSPHQKIGGVRYRGKTFALDTLELQGCTLQPFELFEWLAERECRPRELRVFRAVEWDLDLIQRYMKFVGPALEAFAFAPVFLPNHQSNLQCLWPHLPKRMGYVKMWCNPNVKSLTCRLLGSPYKEKSAWPPVLLQDALATGCPLEEITFEMSVPSSKWLRKKVWTGNIDVVEEYIRRGTLKKVAFVHSPQPKEVGFKSLRDATPALRQRFDYLEKEVDLKIMNAPTMDLSGRGPNERN